MEGVGRIGFETGEFDGEKVGCDGGGEGEIFTVEEWEAFPAGGHGLD